MHGLDMVMSAKMTLIVVQAQGKGDQGGPTLSEYRSF